jgi:hypothetical protein
MLHNFAAPYYNFTIVKRQSAENPAVKSLGLYKLNNRSDESYQFGTAHLHTVRSNYEIFSTSGNTYLAYGLLVLFSFAYFHRNGDPDLIKSFTTLTAVCEVVW